MERGEVLREADRLQKLSCDLVLEGCPEVLTELLNETIFELRQYALEKKGE